MGLFAHALKAAMDEMRWSQTALATRIKSVSQPTVSRYLTTDDVPKLETLEEVCLQLPQHLREELTAAYLTDLIPAAVGNKIKIVAMREGVEEPVRYETGRAPEGSELRNNLLILERWAMEDETVERVIASLADGYDGRRRAVRYRTNEEGSIGSSVEQDLADAERRVAEQQEQSTPISTAKKKSGPKQGK